MLEGRALLAAALAGMLWLVGMAEEASAALGGQEAEVAQVAQVAQGARQAGDTSLEERAQRLAQELRCLVCQNQTIADSHAELAVQLKAELREQLRQGATDEQVRQFMVDRYGEFVLYRPPLNLTTALLWGSPLVLLLAGGGLFLAHVRERKRALQGLPDSQLPDALDGDCHEAENDAANEGRGST